MCIFYLRSTLLCLPVLVIFFLVMNLVGRPASPAATRRLLVGLRLLNGYAGRIPSRGYIGAVTRARTTDQFDTSSPSRTSRQAQIRRHLTTTKTAKHAEPLSNTHLDLSFSTDTEMASLTPPQPPLSWQHTVEDIERLTTEALAKDKQVSDDIAQLSGEKLDFDNVSTPLALPPPLIV